MVSLTLELAKPVLGTVKAEDLAIFSPAVTEKVRNFHTSMWGYYHPTPLIEMPALARHIAVNRIFVKDESQRFGLKAFYALGVSYALAVFLAKKFGLELSFDALQEYNFAFRQPGLTVAAATNGNYGVAVAWFAHLLGLRAVIYVPERTSEELVQLLLAQKAEVKLVGKDFAEALQQLRQDSAEHNWFIIQDMAWEDYHAFPLAIMQGYSTLLIEALEALPLMPTHIFIQTGTGALAAAVEAVLKHKYKESMPKVILLEAEAANCYYRSLSKGIEQNITNPVHSIMADLACGQINEPDWDILKNLTSYSLSCHEEVATLGMRVFASPLPKDTVITAGPSGALGAGVLGLLKKYHNLQSDMGITKDSVLLLFNTEGDALPVQYRQIVWGGTFPCDLGGTTFA